MNAATSFTPYGHAGMHRMARTALFSLLAWLFCGVRLSAAEPVTTQTIPLAAGWNLVSIQVGTSPLPITGFAAALSAPAQLIEVWGYTPSGNPSIPGSWQTYQPKVAGFAHDLTAVQPGRGYWVNVAQFVQAKLTGIRWDGAVSLQTGWNLVGFPGFDLAPNEAMDLTSVFGSQLGRIQQVWTFDKSLGRFSGYDVTAIPALKELSVIRPASGYWIYALDTVAVSPQPYVTLPGDADASPLETELAFSAPDFPGLPNPTDYIGSLIRKVDDEDEDFDLNGNGIIDSAFTQNVLRFDIGVDRKVITLGNRGTGLANWMLSNSVPWLFTAPSDAKIYPNNTGRPKSASGVVSADRDSVTLYADTTGLLPGIQTGTITLYVGTLVKTITVKLEVPTSAGDWKGYATTQRVNGKAIPIGSVDMGINLFMLSGNTNESRFRAVLNKDSSLLFPRDVFMNGVFYSGNQFSLTTNFEMPTGDRNAPPFDTFPAKRATGAAVPVMQPRADYDADGNGKLNVENPFPFPVRREITLLGRRLSHSRMEGNYVESITGMLPSGQPIFVEGSFFLDRQTLEPTKRSIFNQTTTNNPILIGSTSGQLYRETTINVSSAVSIQSITLALNLNFPDPAKVTISLIGPTRKTVVIHNGGGTLPTSVDLSDYNGLLGNGVWKLRVAWLPTGERGTFTSWGLNIQGLATYSITGKIVGDTNGDSVSEPLGGGHLVLTGSNLIEQTDTASDGTFTIPNLTENNYSLSLSKPGFEPRLVSFFVNNTSLYVGQSGAVAATGNPNDPLILTPVSVPSPVLRAGPFVGQEPLHVDLTALIPLANLNALGTLTGASWDFGDGTPVVTDSASTLDEVNQTTAAHIYEKAGVYTPTVTLNGTSGSLPISSTRILVHRMLADPAASSPGFQAVGVSLVGALAAPLSNGGNPVQVSNGSTLASYDITNDGNPPLTSIPAGTIYQESRRDAAGFDIDRFPKIAQSDRSDFRPLMEDTDFGDTSKLVYVSGDGSVSLPFLVRSYSQLTANEQSDFSEDISPNTYRDYSPPEVSGQVIPDRFRLVPILGGSVFATESPKVGDFVLQVGRVEP